MTAITAVICCLGVGRLTRDNWEAVELEANGHAYLHQPLGRLMRRMWNVSQAQCTKIFSLALTLLVAVGCAAAPVVAPPSDAPAAAAAAEPSPPARVTQSPEPPEASCPAALLDGRLEERRGQLHAVHGDEAVRLIWGPGYSLVVRRSAETEILVVEGAAGEVVAREGDVVSLGGGFVGPGPDQAWLVCGDVAVRGPAEEPTPQPTRAGASSLPFAPKAELEIVGYGFSTYRDVYDGDESSVSWAVVVQNPNSGALARHVRVVVDLLDSRGDTVHSATEKWDAILPGQSVAYADEIGVVVSGELHTITSMNVEIVHNSPWEAVSDVAGEFSFSNVSTVRFELGGIRTTASLVSTFQADTPAVVVAIYRSGGAMIGGANTFVDGVPAGGELPIYVDGPRGLGPFDDTVLFAHLTAPESGRQRR